MPPRMFKSVVLPAPDCPTITQISPSAIVNEASFSASMRTSPI